MSRQDGEFDKHGGRNAFRNAADDVNLTSTERAASLRAMRSFTESIEDDVGPPELPPHLDIDVIGCSTSGMSASNTTDTIIEVATGADPMTSSTSSDKNRPSKKPKVDPQLGETQKYKMAVPGPGHSEQEQELHKSLIRDNDDDNDAEVEALFGKGDIAPPTSLPFEEPPTHEQLRREYSAAAVQRRRPTTPTSGCVLDGIAFFGGDELPDVPKEEKIKVSIPAGSRTRRRSDMTYSDFYDQMAAQMPNQIKRASNSGRTTPLNDYDGDILEENPNYKDKVPPAPVIHRRSSVEWENFEDMQEKMDVAEESEKVEEKLEKAANVEVKPKTKKLGFHAKPPTVEITSPDAPHSGAFHDPVAEDNDEEPTFSEDMVEERKRLKKATKKKPNDGVVDEKPSPVPEEEEVDVVPHTTDVMVTDQGQIPVEQESGEGQEVQQEQQQEQEQECDPNAYPGYIWNYDTQQWDVDLNYDHSQGQAQAQNEEAPTTLEAPQAAPEAIPGEYDYDYTEYGGYHAYMAAHGYVYDDVTGSYSYPNYEDPYHAGYDQGQYTTEAVGAAEASPADYSQYYQDPQSSQYYPDQYYQDPQAVPDTAGQYYQDPNGAVDYYQASQAVPDASGQYYQDQQYYPDPNGTSDAAQQYYQDPQAVPDASGQYYEDPQASHQYYQDPQAVPDASTQYYQNPDVAQQYYQDPQAVPDPSSQYYPDPNGTAQQYYQDPAYHAGYDQPEEHHPPPRPAVPVFTEPLFKQQQNVQDPYAWDSSAVAQAPAQAPVRPAAPSRPEPPKPHETTYDAPAPPRPPPAARPPPPRPAPAAAPKPKEPEPAPEEDAWTQFKKMTEKVSDVVKNTESTLKNLSETSATKDIKDESYLAEIGGSQGFVNESTQREIQRLTEEKKNEKLLKKKLKQQGKKVQSPTYDPDEEDAMDRAAQELAMKMANNRTDIGDWKPPPGVAEEIKKAPEKPAREEDSISAIPPRKKSSIKDVHQDSGGSLELPMHLSAQKQDSISPKGDFAPDDPILSAPAWADFESTDPVLPPSESGFFSNKDNANDTSNDIADPFQTATSTVTTNGSSDPFAPVAPSLIDDSYDPFAVRPVEDVVAMAKAKAEEAAAAAADDDDFFVGDRHSPALSTPTPEGGSPLSQRPNRFEDDFKCEGMGLDTPTPLYDEDDTEPLTEYLPRFSGDGWDLMIRHPIKKKSFMAERYWKPCFVRLHGTTLLVYNDRKDSSPIQELLLQATYSLSDTTLQAYDVYGKIHTVKLQFVVYKEKVGIRPGQISRLVEGHVTKYGLPLEHSAQCTVLLKFGSLNAPELQSFVTTVEDILFKCHISRTTKPVYKQDEVQIHCYDEYSAFVDKDGVLSDQKARVRMFCLAFLTGTPFLEIGLNDRRRQGKEIVRRKDILPMHTERWIRFEALEFHSIVDRNEFDKEQVIRFSPPDGCFFEIMRFRIRPPRNREKAMTVKSIMKIAGSKVEIRIEAMAAAQIQRTRGAEERRNIPCEDIAIRFPIPEAWIYIFREERHWGVGSVHSKKLRPGKVKNLKDRLLGAVQTHEANLIECAIGEAKYEHVYRSLVWRIPRLPEKHHAAYKSHLLRCRFELSSFDLMPEEFLPRCEVDFTMPLATVSNTVVRSVSVEQHEDSDRVEKFVRYVAKYQYKVEIDYIQCANLDIDTADPSVNPEAAAAPVPDLHAPQIHPDGVSKMHEGYRIDFDESEMGRHGRKDDDSSSDDEVDSHKMPVIQIDMKNYGY